MHKGGKDIDMKCTHQASMSSLSSLMVVIVNLHFDGDYAKSVEFHTETPGCVFHFTKRTES